MTVPQNRSVTESETKKFHSGIPEIVRQLKVFASKRINNIMSGGNQSIILSKQKIWQKSYYEHIIRNESEYIRISKYIIDNPINWQFDKLHT